jgi:hypothetical protein
MCENLGQWWMKGEVRVQNNLGWYERSYNAYRSHKVPHVQVITKSRNKAMNVLKFTYNAAAILYIKAKLRSRSGFTLWRHCAVSRERIYIQISKQHSNFTGDFSSFINTYFGKMPYCMVPGCTNCSKKTKGSDISYHHLPNDQQMRRTWLDVFVVTTCRKLIRAMFAALILPQIVSRVLLKNYMAWKGKRL